MANIKINSNDMFWDDASGDISGKHFRPTVLSVSQLNELKKQDGRFIVTKEGRMFFDNGDNNRIELGNAPIGEYVVIQGEIPSANVNDNKIRLVPTSETGAYSTSIIDGGIVNETISSEELKYSIFKMYYNGNYIGTKGVFVDNELYALKENYNPMYIKGQEAIATNTNGTIAFGKIDSNGTKTWPRTGFPAVRVTEIKNSSENNATLTLEPIGGILNLTDNLKNQLINITGRPYCARITKIEGNKITVSIVDNQGKLEQSGETYFWIDNYANIVSNTTASPGQCQVAIGTGVRAISGHAVGFGKNNFASGQFSFVQGENNHAGLFTTVFGQNNKGYGKYQLVFGSNNTSRYSHNLVFGSNNVTTKSYNLTFGKNIENNGNYSIAVGEGSETNPFSITNSNYSFGLGKYITITGENNDTASHSFAFGGWVNIKGDYSFGLGEQVDVGGDYSFAFGNKAKVENNYSFAFGDSVKINGAYSFAFGSPGDYGEDGEPIPTIINGSHSIAIGSACAIGTMGQNGLPSNYSCAIGFKNIIKPGADYSFALGNNNRIQENHKSNYLIGNHLTSGKNGTCVIVGNYNNYDNNVLENALFVVGNGTDDGNRSNAFIVKTNESIFNTNLNLNKNKLILSSGDGSDNSQEAFIASYSDGKDKDIHFNDEIMLYYNPGVETDGSDARSIFAPVKGKKGQLGLSDSPWHSVYVKDVYINNSLNMDNMCFKHFYMNPEHYKNNSFTIDLTKGNNRAFFLVGITPNGQNAEPALYQVAVNLWDKDNSEQTVKFNKINGNNNINLTCAIKNSILTLTISKTQGATNNFHEYAEVFVQGSWS